MEGVIKIFNDFEKTKSVGCATLVKFEVDTQTSNGTRLRALLNGFRWEYVSPGAYIKLIVDGELMMSDTNMEKDSILTCKRIIVLLCPNLPMKEWIKMQLF